MGLAARVSWAARGYVAAGRRVVRPNSRSLDHSPEANSATLSLRPAQGLAKAGRPRRMQAFAAQRGWRSRNFTTQVICVPLAILAAPGCTIKGGRGGSSVSLWSTPGVEGLDVRGWFPSRSNDGPPTRSESVFPRRGESEKRPPLRAAFQQRLATRRSAERDAEIAPGAARGQSNPAEAE